MSDDEDDLEMNERQRRVLDGGSDVPESDENGGEERGYGPEDFRKYPVEVDIELPPEAWEEACERFHTGREKGYEADLMDYLRDLIDLEYNWKVLAEDRDDPPAEPPEDGEEWEEAGRALFNWVHAQVRGDVVTALDQLSWKVDQGEPISKSDVQHLRHGLEDAEFLAQQAATVCPDTEPHADWKEVLGDEAVREFARRVQEDDGE